MTTQPHTRKLLQYPQPVTPIFHRVKLPSAAYFIVKIEGLHVTTYLAGRERELVDLFNRLHMDLLLEDYTGTRTSFGFHYTHADLADAYLIVYQSSNITSSEL